MEIIFALFMIVASIYSLNRPDNSWERVKQRYQRQGLEVRRTDAWDKQQQTDSKVGMVLSVLFLIYGLLFHFGSKQIVAILRLDFLPFPLIGSVLGTFLIVWGLIGIIFSEKVWEISKKRSKLEFITDEIPNNLYSESILFGGLAILLGLAILFFRLVVYSKC